MSVALEDVFRQNQDAASRVIDGLAYVVDPVTGDLHSFNEVATLVWTLLDGTRSVREVVARMVDEYEVDRLTAEADAVELLEDLQAKQLVVRT
jgi:hypothetical protein